MSGTSALSGWQPPVKSHWQWRSTRHGRGQVSGVAEDDSIHMFNFALSIGPEHLATLKGFHFHFVNPQALRVEPCLMGWLAALPQRCPLARVAVLCRA